MSTPKFVTERSDEPACGWELYLLGPVHVVWRQENGTPHEVTSALAPRHVELLVLLALFASGTTRDHVREVLWPNARGARPNNVYHATLSQLRKALKRVVGPHRELVCHQGHHVRIDPQVYVDFWQLRAAERAQERASTNDGRVAAWRRLVELYHGDLATGVSAPWVEGPRETTRRTVVDALSGMAAYYREHGEQQRSLYCLEHARELAPDNEALYRAIMYAQAQLGMTDAISRTVQLLTTNLTAIGARPHPDTLTLARSLQHEHLKSG